MQLETWSLTVFLFQVHPVHFQHLKGQLYIVDFLAVAERRHPKPLRQTPVLGKEFQYTPDAER